MKVDLIAWTPEPEKIAYIAARRCASGKSYDELLREYDAAGKEKVEKLLRKVAQSGHLSVLEHVMFTFHIDGVSRALSHQLVRHRLASYSQMSQRYVRAGECFIIPEEFKGELLKEYESAVRQSHEAYKKLIGLGAKPEDARFILPNGAVTALVMTVNARELMHICEERLCLRAQWEIRELALRMGELAAGAFPFLADFLGPKCLRLGRCPESSGPCENFGQTIASRR